MAKQNLYTDKNINPNLLKLFRILKNLGVYEKFRCNIKLALLENFKMSNGSASLLFMQAFSWRLTKEGVAFWAKIGGRIEELEGD